MKKKIAIGILIILMAIFAIGYYAVQFAQQQLSETFKQHHITFQQSELTLFPQPYVALHQVRWTDNKNLILEAQQINLQLDFQSLLNLSNGVKKLQIEQAKIWHSGQAEADFKNINAQIEGRLWLEKSAVNLADFSANIQFDKPILFNTNHIKLSVAEGKIYPLASQQYQADFVQVQLNGELLPQVKNNIQWNAHQQQIRTEIHQQNATTSHLVVQIKSKPRTQVQFQARQLIVQQWQNILNLPHFLTGIADGKGNFSMQENKIEQGAVQLSVSNGELDGLNLLQMIERYLPIKLSHSTSTQKNKTAFEYLNSDIEWNAQQINLRDLHLQNATIVVRGKGTSDLQNLQCDFQLSVGLTHPNFQQLNLPVQIFDRCYAPKYKVGFDKNLRQGLKELLKSKFR